MKNTILVFFDAYRFDAICDPEASAALTPAIRQLAQGGHIVRLVANAHTTKMVVPSLLTETYPLDYEGYNNGISERPRSVAEAYKDAGFDTWYFGGTDIDGPQGGCERGFDHVSVFYAKWLATEGFVKKKILYDIANWKKGKISDEKVIGVIQKEYGSLIRHLLRSTGRAGTGILGPYTRKERARMQQELHLIEADPIAVVEKLSICTPRFLHHHFGARESWFKVRAENRLFSYGKRLQTAIQKLFKIDAAVLASRPRVLPPANKVMDAVMKAVDKAEAPWFMLVHFLDAHHHMIANRPFRYLKKFRNIFQVLKARRIERDNRGVCTRELSYDLALAEVDRQLARLVAHLHKRGQLDDTDIVIFGDHGLGWDQGRDKTLKTNFGFRTHYEHVEVPLVVSAHGDKTLGKGLHDSMSVAATLADLAGLPRHSSWKGVSVFDDAHDFVITENCGRGNADIDNRDLYFTVTGLTSKLMIRLAGNELIAERFYDTANDPREINNILPTVANEQLAPLVKALFEQRSELLARRGVSAGVFRTIEEDRTTQ